MIVYFGFNMQSFEGPKKESIRYSMRAILTICAWTFLLHLTLIPKKVDLGLVLNKTHAQMPNDG